MARDRAGERIEAFEAHDPGLVAFAGELVATGRADELRGLALRDAMRAVWPNLAAIAAST